MNGDLEFDPILILLFIGCVFSIWSWWRAPSDEPVYQLVLRRSPVRVYQDGVSVGDVIGEVTQAGTRITFKQIVNTKNLNRGAALEYQGLNLRLMEVGREVKCVESDDNWFKSTLYYVKQNVICEVIENHAESAAKVEV
jgi:hypothetical protein